MTYEDIVKANSSLKTMPVKGKDYVEVNQRVKAFRMLYPEGTISTDIIALEDGVVTMKCSVFDGDRLLATGLAQEKESSSYINKTSFIENCETSACGRALGFLGLGIDTSIASAEEVGNAIENQEPKKTDSKPIKTETAYPAKATMIHDLTSKLGGAQTKQLLDYWGAKSFDDVDEPKLQTAWRKYCN